METLIKGETINPGRVPCKYCGCAIFWGLLTTGRWLALQADADGGPARSAEGAYLHHKPYCVPATHHIAPRALDVAAVQRRLVLNADAGKTTRVTQEEARVLLAALDAAGAKPDAPTKKVRRALPPGWHVFQGGRAA